jgi:hypothetical protein
MLKKFLRHLFIDNGKARPLVFAFGLGELATTQKLDADQA